MSEPATALAADQAAIVPTSRPSITALARVAEVSRPTMRAVLRAADTGHLQRIEDGSLTPSQYRRLYRASALTLLEPLKDDDGRTVTLSARRAAKVADIVYHVRRTAQRRAVRDRWRDLAPTTPPAPE